MGTRLEWVRVLEIGAFYGLGLLFFDAMKGVKRAVAPSNLIATALASFGFGMVFVFEWRVVHGWMAALVAALFIGTLAVGLITRRASSRANPR